MQEVAASKLKGKKEICNPDLDVVAQGYFWLSYFIQCCYEKISQHQLNWSRISNSYTAVALG